MEAFLVLLALLFLILPVIAIAVAVSGRNKLLKRIERLEKQVAALRDQRGGATATAVAAEPTEKPRAMNVAEPMHDAEPIHATETMNDAESIPATEPMDAAEPVHATEPIHTPVAARSPREAERPQRPSRTNQEWEALVGGRVLNLIGAVALIIGIGFFLKYAFDNNWISETVRAMIGGAFGIALLVLGGLSSRKGYKVFSQGLVGAGISVLYLSVYAAFNYYHIGLSQTLALVMMAAVTVIAFHQAFTYDSFAVALLGLIGGFLTPLLLSTGTANEVGLFTYIAILDAGLLAIVARKRSWDGLIPLSFIGTMIFYVGWYDQYYLPADRVVTIIYITIFWLLYYATDLLAQRRTEEGTERPLAHAVAIANMIGYYGALFMLLEDRRNPWLVGATIALGAAYLLPIALPSLRPKPGSFFAERNLIAAMTLFALAAQLAPLEDSAEFLRLVIWSAMGLAFFRIGARLGLGSMWLGGLLLFLLTFLGSEMYETLAPLVWSPPLLVLYRVEVVLGVLAISLLAAARGTAGIDEKLRKPLQGLLGIGFCVTIFMLLLHLVDHQVEGYAYAGSTSAAGEFSQRLMIPLPRLRFLQEMWESLAWLGYGLLLMWRGVRRKDIVAIYSGLIVLAIAMIWGAINGVAFEPIESFVPVLNIRALTLAAAAISGVLAMRMLRRFDDVRMVGTARTVIEIAVVMIVFGLLTVETVDLFGRMIHDASATAGIAAAGVQSRITYLENMEQIALSGIWLLYSAMLMVVGIARSIRILRIISFALFGLTILKIFIYDLSFLDTLYRIFSFIGLGVILLLISFLYGRYKDLIFGTEPQEKPI